MQAKVQHQFYQWAVNTGLSIQLSKDFVFFFHNENKNHIHDPALLERCYISVTIH